MADKRFNSLFFQAVIVLILISIIPVFIIGFHVLRVDSRVLKNEILQKQQSVARRVLAMSRSNLMYQEQLLAVFLELHTGNKHSNNFTVQDLEFFRQSSPSFLQISALDTNGDIVLSTPNSLDDTLRSVSREMVAT